MSGVGIRREVIIPAVGWIISGLISIYVWYAENANTVCYCPNIPANSTLKQISSICRCNTSANLLYIGILVIIVGIALLLLNGRIGKIIDKYKIKKKK